MAKVSTRKSVYAVVSFSKARGGVAIDGMTQARGEATALRLAERLAAERHAAVAFYRVGDPEVGEFDDPVVIGRFGEVPWELAEAIGL